MGSVVDFVFGGGSSTTKIYQKLGELQRQTAKEAEPRPIVWGRVRPISGNIIHASAVTREMVEVGRTTTGGKGGGGKQTQIQYQERAYRTYAIRICEGPITDIVRVWKNDKLVYDARGNEWGDKNNSAFLKYAKFYLGDWDQMPDPALEAIWGAGNVPAYRGTCYMRVDNEDVTDFGGRVPVYTFEVQRERRTFYLTSEVYAPSDVTSEVYAPSDATSPPYAVEDEASAIGANHSVAPGRTPTTESLQGQTISIISGELRSNISEYSLGDNVDGLSNNVVSGNFKTVLIAYNLQDSADGMETSVLSGAFRAGLVRYEEWPIESLDGQSSSIISGDLSQ